MKIRRLTVYVSDFDDLTLDDVKHELSQSRNIFLHTFLDDECEVNEDDFENSVLNSKETTKREAELAFRNFMLAHIHY